MVPVIGVMISNNGHFGCHCRIESAITGTCPSLQCSSVVVQGGQQGKQMLVAFLGSARQGLSKEPIMAPEVPTVLGGLLK